MRRAVDHAFLDEFGANRAEGVDSDAEGFGDVAATLGAGPETGHSTQKAFFARGEPVPGENGFLMGSIYAAMDL